MTGFLPLPTKHRNARKNDPDRKVFIYGVLEPHANIIRYVGRTFDLQARMQSLSDEAHADQHHRPVAKWVRGHLERSMLPRFVVLEHTTQHIMADREKAWIRHYLAMGQKIGVPLLNVSLVNHGPY